jgi:CheY-like chemotaxis protein
VVVVNDEADARELVTVVLELSGAMVTAFGSAGEALNLFMGHTILRLDILISDLFMPGEDGMRLICKLREWERKHGGALPAIALTAFGRAKDRTHALEAGFQTHVTKPAAPVELVITVRKWQADVVEYGIRTRIIWQINRDGTSNSLFVNSYGSTRSISKWRLSDGMLYQRFRDGRAAGVIKWIDDDHFELTILYNQNLNSKGFIRRYSRIL